jgi:hypothetical protein
MQARAFVEVRRGIADSEHMSNDAWADEAIRKLLVRVCAGLAAEFNCMALALRAKR